MRLGVQRGYTLPRILAERTLPQLQTQVVAKPEDSLYWGPIKNLPASFGEADRARLTAAYRAAIESKIVPAYRKLHDFMRDEYLPRTRTSAGLDALPDGKAWYAYNVSDITTTDYTPEQIHQIGLDEVARIHGEMARIMQRVGFKGTLQEFFTHMNTDPQFFFDNREDADRRLRGHQESRAATIAEACSTSCRGQTTKCGPSSRSGRRAPRAGSTRRQAKTGRAPVFSMPTLMTCARDRNGRWRRFRCTRAVPVTTSRSRSSASNKDLPRFRRFGGYTAYVEGWGLYAESLGPDLGMYVDPYQYFGRLEAELWRAIRLVVDTGLHAKGWTREQVLNYMAANSSAAEARRVSEAERYMAIPGQALAYKIGQMKISELRAGRRRNSGRTSMSASSIRPSLATAPCRSTCSRRRSIAGSPARSRRFNLPTRARTTGRTASSRARPAA